MTPERDTAVAIATRITQKLFERVWLPWSPALDRAIARAIDATIAAAVAQALNQLREDGLREDSLWRDLDALARVANPSEDCDRDADACRNDAERRGLYAFRAWQRVRTEERRHDA